MGTDYATVYRVVMSEQEPEAPPYVEPDGGQDREPTEKPEEDKHPDG